MRTGLITLLLICFFCLTGLESSAQYFRNQGYWKQNRLALTAGIGASNFLGELGGRDQTGSGFIWDLDTKVFKPAISGGIRYVVARKMAIRASASYAILAGDDALTKEPFRRNRNIHFQSSLLEIGGMLEYTLYEVRAGHQHNLAGVKGRKPRAANIYLFAGVAGIKFNPKGYINNEWVELKPLGTEGQNFADGAEPYSLFSLAIPMGVGYRWQIGNPNVMMGVEIGHRFTRTDYIDDVSTEYYSQSELLDQPGLSELQNFQAAYFGDPSLGILELENGETIPIGRIAPGEVRGDPSDRDAYFFAQVTLMYKISKNPYKRKKVSQKRGKRVVF